MSRPVITVENLSKSYLVGHEAAQSERYKSLRDVVAREARNFVRNTQRRRNTSRALFVRPLATPAASSNSDPAPAAMADCCLRWDSMCMALRAAPT
jgi:hypothetical protein